MNDLKAKEERLKAKIERIQRLFPNPTGKEAELVEASITKTQAKLREIQKQTTK